MSELKETLRKILEKRAEGYVKREVTEEFVVGDDGKLTLAKRKVSSKDVPPDLGAVRLLLMQTGDREFERFTDEDLERMKTELTAQLAGYTELTEDIDEDS